MYEAGEVENHAANACSIYRTRAGFGALVGNDLGLVAHHLPFAANCAAAALELVARHHPRAQAESPLTTQGGELLARYFAGEEVTFTLPLQLGRFSQFRQGVYRMTAGIPYGTTVSYAEVALACGSPKGARGVGSAMAANPLPILIPCHRVVGAGGLMTGFSAPGGVASKRELLILEGVLFDARGALQKRAAGRL